MFRWCFIVECLTSFLVSFYIHALAIFHVVIIEATFKMPLSLSFAFRPLQYLWWTTGAASHVLQALFPSLQFSFLLVLNFSNFSKFPDSSFCPTFESIKWMISSTFYFSSFKKVFRVLIAITIFSTSLNLTLFTPSLNSFLFFFLFLLL